MSTTPKDPYTYAAGFGNTISLSAKDLPDTIPPGTSLLPARGNNPHHHPYGLYTEQLSGTAFTAPRHLNAKTWLYRIHPSVGHTPFVPAHLPNENLLLSSFTDLRDERLAPTPTQLRWSAPRMDVGVEEEEEKKKNGGKGLTWLESLRTLCGAGETQMKNGLAIHVYTFTRGMHHQAFYNSDGDMVLLPVRGTLRVRTEFGWVQVAVGEIFVVQRGVKFAVFLAGEEGEEGESTTTTTTEGAAGYVLETYSATHFTLPPLGVIGSNGLADPKDFLHPVPSYDSHTYPYTNPTTSTVHPTFTLLTKFLGTISHCTQPHSAFNVPAYTGTYLPYKYPLSQFCPMGNTAFDHADPSIFTVLTLPSPALGEGTALADIVVFPPRWLCGEDTFRPPWFHRNVMSEFLINVCGEYDAKAAAGKGEGAEEGGFGPGAASLHGMNAAHGPDVASYTGEMAREEKAGPRKVGGGSLAVMFETGLQLVTTRWAVEAAQRGYLRCWEGFEMEWPQGRRAAGK